MQINNDIDNFSLLGLTDFFLYELDKVDLVVLTYILQFILVLVAKCGIFSSRTYKPF